MSGGVTLAASASDLCPGHDFIDRDNDGIEDGCDGCPEWGQACLDFTMSDTCPVTEITFEIGGVTPNGMIAVAWSPQLENFTVPSGGCAGTEVKVTNLLATVPADSQGEFSVTIEVPAEFCYVLLQAVDLNSCTVSEVPCGELWLLDC